MSGLQTPFSAAELKQFESDGFVLVRSLYTSDEMRKLLDFTQADPRLTGSTYGKKDASGQETKLALWNDPGEDLYSMFSRNPRNVDRMEQLLGGEVYHWHTKMMQKEPKVGGAWEWHQDYGYWYNDGCLFPDMASCLISVTRSNQENGCLQVIPGSHRLGRIDHSKTGGQTGADQERVDAALERLGLHYVEAEPGDALFFHGNVLHRSDQNRSEFPRWSLISCYNAARNDPYKPSKHPSYTPLVKVAVDAINAWQPVETV